MSEFIRGIVVNTYPEGSSAGEIFTQQVVVNISGRELDFFFPSSENIEEFVNKLENLVINIPIADSIEKMNEKKFAIVSSSEPIIDKSGHLKKAGYGHSFYGKIEKIDQNNLIVNVGSGKINVEISEHNSLKFKIDDFVKIVSFHAEIDFPKLRHRQL